MSDEYPGAIPVEKTNAVDGDYPGASPVGTVEKKPAMYGRGQLPIPNSHQELVTNQNLLDAAMMVPTIGVEAGLLKGGTALENVATRAYPKVAQLFGEGKVVPKLMTAPKIATAGAGGGATYGVGTGRDVGESAEIGAGGALVPEVIGIGKGIKSAFSKPLPQATVDIINAAKAAGFNITAKTPEGINKQIQDWFNGATEKLANNVSEGTANSEVWPMGKSFAISKNYDKADAAVTKSYKAAEAVGKDQHVDAEPVVQGLKNIIDDMEKKAEENIHIPEYAATLAQFKRLYKEIGEGKPSSLILDANGQPLKTSVPNTLTANKLVEIKQTLNRYHVSAPEMTSEDVPYAKLSAVVQNSIKNTSPEFQQAIGKANKEWTEFSNTYRKNKVLKQFWTPEDHDAFKALTQRNIPINQEMEKRVYKMLDKIKTPADLEALRLAMKDYPKEYDSIRAAKFYELMDKAKIDVRSLEKNYDVIIKSLEGDPQAQHVVDAIKTLVEQFNQREIGNISQAAATQRENLIARSIKFILNTFTGSKLAFAKKITDVMRPEEASAIQQRLGNVKKELSKKEPLPTSAEDTKTKIVSPIVGTQIGERTNNVSQQDDGG